MTYSKSTNVNNILLFLIVFSQVFLLPVSLKTQFAGNLGQVFGYITIIYVVYSGLRSNELKISTNEASVFLVVVFWVILSLINSIRLFDAYGVLSGENTFTAPLGSLYFHIAYLFMFIAYVCLIRKCDEVEKIISKAINIVIWLQLSIGFIQLLVVFGFPIIRYIYDFINFADFLPESSFLITMSRITMTGSEPASMGSALGIISFPYLFTVIKESNSSKEKRSCWIKIILLLLLAYFSKSSTVFAIVAITSLCFIINLLKENRISKGMAFVGIAFIFGLSIVLFLSVFGGSILFSGKVIEELYYYLVVKPSDTGNMSTMHRFSTTINDAVIISKHPILGVGDGNQGFTYGENVPRFMLINPKSKEFARGIGGVVNGGAWFWAILSGYGIVGVFPLVWWILSSYRKKVKSLRENAFLYHFYIFALPAIFFTLLTGAMEPKMLFVLSIPLWNLNKNVNVIDNESISDNGEEDGIN